MIIVTIEILVFVKMTNTKTTNMIITKNIAKAKKLLLAQVLPELLVLQV